MGLWGLRASALRAAAYSRYEAKLVKRALVRQLLQVHLPCRAIDGKIISSYVLPSIGKSDRTATYYNIVQYEGEKFWEPGVSAR